MERNVVELVSVKRSRSFLGSISIEVAAVVRTSSKCLACLPYFCYFKNEYIFLISCECQFIVLKAFNKKALYWV